MTIVLSVLLVVCLVVIAKLVSDRRHFIASIKTWQEIYDELRRDRKADADEYTTHLAAVSERLRLSKEELVKARSEFVNRESELISERDGARGAVHVVQQREKALLRRMAMIRGQATVVCQKCMLDVCNCDAPKVPSPQPRPDEKIGHVGEFGQLAKSVLKEAGIPENAPTPAFPPVLRVGDPMERFGDY